MLAISAESSVEVVPHVSLVDATLGRALTSLHLERGDQSLGNTDSFERELS